MWFTQHRPRQVTINIATPALTSKPQLGIRVHVTRCFKAVFLFDHPLGGTPVKPFRICMSLWYYKSNTGLKKRDKGFWSWNFFTLIPKIIFNSILFFFSWASCYFFFLSNPFKRLISAIHIREKKIWVSFSPIPLLLRKRQQFYSYGKSDK